MRRLLLIIMSFMLTAAPVFAQTIQPTPTPRPTTAELQALNQIADLLAKTSSSDNTTVNFVVVALAISLVGIIGVLLVFAVWVARGGLKTFWETLRSERQGREKAEESETHVRTLSDQREKEAAELRKQQAQSLERTAGALERTTNILDSLETKQEASDGRKTTVEAVNQHTTADGDKTREQLQAVVEKVIEAKQTAEKAATIEDLNRVLKPVLDKFDELSVVVRDAIRSADSSTRLRVQAPRRAQDKPPDEEPPSSHDLPALQGVPDN